MPTRLPTAIDEVLRHRAAAPDLHQSSGLLHPHLSSYSHISLTSLLLSLQNHHGHHHCEDEDALYSSPPPTEGWGCTANQLSMVDLASGDQKQGPLLDGRSYSPNLYESGLDCNNN